MMVYWGDLISNIYLRALIILILYLIIAKLSLLFFKKLVPHLIKKAKLRKKVNLNLETPVFLIIVLAGVEIAARQVNSSITSFYHLLDSVIIFIIAYIFVGLINILLDGWQKINEDHYHKEYHAELLPLIKSLSRLTLYGIALILSLQIWGVKVATLLASLGVIGVVLGFAFQDSFKNIFGGLSLTFDNSIRKGDVIKLDSGEIGEVMEINLRSTKIQTFDNDTLIVPNGLLANSKFRNYAQPTPEIRIKIPVSVAYGSDVKKVKKVLLDTIKDREDILALPPRDVRFVKMSDFSLDFDFVFYISDYHNRLTMIDEITTASYNALREAGIEIPFPTRTVYNKT